MSDVTIIELWAAMKEYVPAKDRKEAADHFLATVEDLGLVNVEATFEELFGICSILDRSLRDYAAEADLHCDEDDYNNDWDE